MFNSKVFLAEFIGTFALVFIGAGAGVAQAGLLGVALAHGLTVAVFAYAYGHISGTHLNPAVTWAMAWLEKITWGQAAVYFLAQFLGAASAAVFLKLAVGDISSGATVGSLTESAPIMAAVVEAVLTFFLVNTILHTAVAGNGGKLAGLAIGLTLTASILVGGPLTGASLNPARTFGPAIYTDPSFANVYTYVIYFFGPLIGSTLAVIAFNFFNGKPEAAEEPVKAKKTVARKSAKK